MSKLVDFKELELSLKAEKSLSIKNLHKLIFGDVGDRNNRRRIRNFTGFSFETDSDEYKSKLQEIKDNFSVNELITICNVLCINNSGTFDEIAARIISCLCDFKVLKSNLILDEGVLSEDESDDDSNKNNISSVSENNLRNDSGSSSYENIENQKILIPDYVLKPAISINDIDNMLTEFDGSQFQNVEKWLADFEDTVSLFNVSDLHKLILAKRRMTGRAKLFIESETKINSWSKMKALLISEFGQTCNSAELHELLSKRKMKPNESLDEYFLNMKQLCSKGNIEDSALIQYVINGINDPVFQKSFLYGCPNIVEFKEKLKIYEKLRVDYDIKPDVDVRPKMKPEVEFKNKSRPSKPDIRCYNCGDRFHKSNQCRNKDKGPLCFSCNLYGHKSFECGKNKDSKLPNDSQVNVLTCSQNLVFKDVKLHSLNLISLIDTGSEKTILKKSNFDKIKSYVNLEPTDMLLSGLGKKSFRPIGYFEAEIEIDDSKFQTSIFVIDDKSIEFDLIIGTDVIQQGSLIVSGNDVKLKKSQNNSLVNVINSSEVAVNSKFNPYSSTLHSSNPQIPNQNKYLPVPQLTYSSSEIKELRLENENLTAQVKEIERKYKMLQLDVIDLKEAFLSEKTKSKIAITSLEDKLEQEVTERQTVSKLYRKLERCFQDIKSQLDEESKRSEQYRLRLVKVNNYSKHLEKLLEESEDECSKIKMSKRRIQIKLNNSQEDFENLRQEMTKLKKQIKMTNAAKTLKNDSDSTKLENKENMKYSSRNENNQKFDVINEENLRKENLKKMANHKLKSNVSKKIKNIPKSSDEFEDEIEINEYEVKKPKQKFTKKRPEYRRSFLEENTSKFDLNSEDDTNNSEDDSLTDVDEYGIVPDKFLDSGDYAEFRRSKKSLYDSDYEM